MTGYSNWKKALERFTSHGKSNMHCIAMEAENNNSIKDVIIIHNKNDVRNNNIVLRAIFTFIRYLSQENIAFRGMEHFEGKFLKLLKLRKNEFPQLESWLHMLTDNTRKIHLLSWQIINEIIEIFSYAVLRELIK